MVNQLLVPKETHRFADFERELQRDPRLKSEHTNGFPHRVCRLLLGAKRDYLEIIFGVCFSDVWGRGICSPRNVLSTADYGSKLQLSGTADLLFVPGLAGSW